MATKQVQCGRARVCASACKRPAKAALSNHRRVATTEEAAEALTQRHALNELAGKACVALPTMAPLLVCAPEAVAKGGEYGIFEGRTMSLVHPTMMFFLLGASLWNAYLGFQWRRLRTIGSEISSLKKQIPATVRTLRLSPFSCL